MGINEISKAGILLRPIQPKKVQNEKTAEASKKDQVELSDEAKAMYASDQTKKLGEIQERISSGFYNSPEVMAKVVDAMLKEVGE
jgi:anti-sigma28 factor (negative regulator of flagellin synthesis)